MAEAFFCQKIGKRDAGKFSPILAESLLSKTGTRRRAAFDPYADEIRSWLFGLLSIVMDLSETKSKVGKERKWSMKALLIGAGAEALHTIRQAKEKGICVAAMDGNPDAEGLKEADEAYVVNIAKEEEAIAKGKEIQPDFLLTGPIGRYLTTMGAINDQLHLPGIGKLEAMRCTDKWEFHQLLNGCGLRDCACFCFQEGKNWEKGKAVVHEFSYPAVVKPRYGSGSRGIFVVKNAEEAMGALQGIYEPEGFASKKEGEDYLLEEWIKGEEYGVDGAVIGGKFYLVLLRKKENTPFPLRQAVAYFSVSSEEPFYHKTKQYLEKVVKVLGLWDCLLHGDLIRTQKEPFLIELSARPSGHHLHDLFTPLVTGVDLAKSYIAYRLKEEAIFQPMYTKRMMIHYFDLVGDLVYIPTREEVEALAASQGYQLIRWNCRMQVKEHLSQITDGRSLMGRGYYILEDRRTRQAEGEEAEKGLQSMAEKIRGLFRMEKQA